MLLENKNIIVLGAAGRIGRHICSALVEQGSQICAADLNLQGWKEFVAAGIPSNHKQNIFEFTVNTNSDSSLAELLNFCSKKFSHIDGVVNCTYPRTEGLNKSLEDLSYDEFTENLKIHLGSYFLVSKIFSLFMRQQGFGSIVNFSSIYGCIAPRFEIYEGTQMVQPITYAAIKAGVNHISRYIAKYLKGSDVRLNCVSPGGILDRQPDSFLKAYAANCVSKGMLDPQDIVGTVVFLLSDAARYITGQNIVVDDGFCL